MNGLKIPITLLILLAIILPNTLLIPGALAQADPEPQAISGILIGGISCTASNLLARWLLNKLSDGWRWLSSLSVRVDKILSFFKLSYWQAQEVPTGDSRLRDAKNYGDVVGRCFARQIMNEMTARIIGSVRTSGRYNSRNSPDPAFVRNWRNFKLQAQRRGENIFRSMLGSAEICPYFSGNLKGIFNANNQPDVTRYTNTRAGNLDSFKRRSRCPMHRGWSIKSFEQNFAPNGGWEALVRLSEPQNNFYGSLLLSSAELAMQRALEDESDQAEAVSGLGFTSRRGRNLPENCLLTASNGQCIVFKNILTPCSILQQSAAAVVSQELAWLTNVDNLQGVVSDLTNTLLRRILNLSTPDYRTQEQYPPEKYPGPKPDPGLPSCPPTGGYPPEDPSNPDPYTASTEDCPPDIEPPVEPPAAILVSHDEQCSSDSNGNGTPDLCFYWDTYAAGGACEQSAFGLGPCIVVNHQIDPVYVSHINANGGYLAYINENDGSVLYSLSMTSPDIPDGVRCMKNYPAGSWGFRINLDGTGQGLVSQGLNPPTAASGTN